MNHVAHIAKVAFPDWDSLVEAYNPLHIRYPCGELICQVGSYAAGTYLISTGLAIDRFSPERRNSLPSVYEVLGPGDLIGLETFSSGTNDLHLSCTRAVTETELFFFERGVFLHMLKEEKDLQRYCLNYLSHRFHSLKQWVTYLGAPVQERVCHLLLNFVDKLGKPGETKETIYLPPEITLAVLSQLLSISKTRAGRVIASLPKIAWAEDQISLSPEALRVWQSCAGETVTEAKASPR
jgi:CRP-like cAMP-binding protein